MDPLDSLYEQHEQYQAHELDPRRLYSIAPDPPPSADVFRRHYARRAVAIALPLEGAAVIILMALGRSLVIFGLVDGLDEVCGCMSLFAGALITLGAWSLGSLYGSMRYRRDLSIWRKRHRLG